MAQFNEVEYKKMGEVITIQEAAKLLGVHRNTIRRWEKSGMIKSTRVGKRKDRRFNKNDLLREVLNLKVVDGKKEAYEKYYQYLKGLFKLALEKQPVQFLYNTLQVTGMHYGHWDPTYEIYDFFEDFNKILEEETHKNPTSKRVYRIGLLMYCHAVEMSLPWQFLANTLRIINNEPYIIEPFKGLGRRNVPPSTKTKIRKIKELAEAVGENNLINYISEFFHDGVRNSFYHSDYCLTDKEYRYSHNGIATSMPKEKIDTLIVNCFAFYAAFFHNHTLVKSTLKKIKTYHKWPNYEVLEILKNESEVYGFKVHFSNGSVAKFTREPEKVEAINLLFEDDGSLNFFAGNLDELKPLWLVDGKPFEKDKN